MPPDSLPARSSSNEISPAVPSSRLVTLAAPGSVVHPRVISSLARHGMRGERLGMIIGDNRFELFALTRLARQNGYDPARLLSQIELSRAFTCHQLHRRVLTIDHSMTQRWRSLYVLGLLDTFYDESVPVTEAAHLLTQIMQRLRELRSCGLDVLVTAAPPKKPGREKLLELMAHYADEHVEFYRTPTPVHYNSSAPEMFERETSAVSI